MSRLPVCLVLLTGSGLAVGPARADELPAGAVARLGEARFQNIGRVFAVAFAPDGKTLAAGAWDGSLRLWQPATGKLLRKWDGHGGAVRSLAFAPDGKTLASAGRDGTVRLWETATGKELRGLKGSLGDVGTVVFGDKGRVVAARGWDFQARRGVVVLWDVATGKERHRFRGMDTGTLVGEAGGKFLAVGVKSLDDWQAGKFRVWDAATGKELRAFAGPRGWDHPFALSPDGKVLAAGRPYGNQIRLWDLDTGRELRPLKVTTVEFTSLAFSPDGRSLAGAGSDDAIHVWELATGGERCRLRGTDPGNVPLAFSPDGRLLAAGGLDVTTLLWDVTGRAKDGRLRPVKLTPAELRALWDDLKGDDAGKAHRAVWKMVAGAGQSVPFLREAIRPVPAPDPKRFARLIADLDSRRFAVRKQAEEKLKKMGLAAEPVLRQALREPLSLEARQRVQRLLERLGGWPPEQLRALRGLEVLEHVGTPETRAVVEGLARGAAGARLTQEAEATLRRLTRRSANGKG